MATKIYYNFKLEKEDKIQNIVETRNGIFAFTENKIFKLHEGIFRQIKFEKVSENI